MHANIWAVNFHELCFSVAKNSDVVDIPKLTEDQDSEVYFNQLLPEALELAALEKDLHFDVIIVDEGQDFRPAWFRALESLLKDSEDSIYYIFYDDNQRIYNQATIPYKWPSYRLSKNMRNTVQIFSLVQRYYFEPTRIFPSGVTGPDPLFVDLDQFSDELEALESTIQWLVKENNIKLSKIAILTPRSKGKSIWSQKKLPQKKYKLVWNVETFGNQVTCATIYGFKGLEKPVIILTELDGLYPQKAEELLYVGISRARDFLIVLGELPV